MPDEEETAPNELDEQVELEADYEEDDTLAALAEAADELIHPVRPDDLGQKKTRSDTDGRIATDVLCKGCQYNLRGQLPESTCAECGFPVEESLRSEQLRFANLGWLRSLKSGLTLIIIGTLGVTFVYGLFQLVASVVMSSHRIRWNNPAGFGDLDLAIQITIILEFFAFSIPVAILCVGYWYLTKPDPYAEKTIVSQVLTRWSFLSSYSALIGLRLYTLLSIIVVFDLPNSIWFAVALIASSAISLFVGFPAMMIYLRSLAHRLPSHKLMRHTSIVLWGLVGSLAAIGLLAVATTLIRALHQNELAVFLLVLPMLLALVVFSIWWFALLFVYRGRISKSIHSARRLRRASKLDPSQAVAAAAN